MEKQVTQEHAAASGSGFVYIFFAVRALAHGRDLRGATRAADGANPFCGKQKISVRAPNFNSEKLKVNDLRGNPIEIAGTMLHRQQADAVIAARTKIVQGAVGTVELALNGLSERGLVQLDDERKAAMVSNLLVVLCSDRDATLVVNAGNAGTLYA